ncbi:MAG: IF-2-associated domain-containing protein, partial [Hyphomicrobiaceae bacterium]|nr:IF-2-associated domain-containing protein [Hyphomicrobiaceae bacterium]
MSETKDTTDKTILGRVRKPLSLQRTVESGHVRQNFSHGRSKSVVVEKRRTRKLAGPGAAQEAKPALQEAKPATPAPKKKPVKAETATPV